MKNQGIFSLLNQLIKHPIYTRIVFIWLALFCLANAGVNAGEMLDARINIGLKLFRAILAADLQIKTKKNANKELPLLLIYKDNPKRGQQFAQYLLQLGKKNSPAQIKKIPLRVSYISYQTFLVGQHERPAGIFLVDQMSSKELAAITRYGIQNQLITFSPFEGDVQKDIAAGLSIGARVRPEINITTLNASEIKIKAFFLKVAKKHEP